MMIAHKKKWLYTGGITLFIFFLLIVFSPKILMLAGQWVVVSDTPLRSDAIVVLHTGVELYPRLIQAADLYSQGYADKVVINGNRKTDVLRELERKGFRGCCAWYEDSIRVLNLMGVPRNKVVSISAEDAYDTVSEAEIVGRAVIESGASRILLATSKYHTRRARFIWKKMYAGQLEIRAVAAKSDLYNPNSWWHEGKQIRWVLAEYGAWLYYFWKSFENGADRAQLE